MTITLLRGDCRDLLDTLEPASVQTIITSPPYWRLRRYTDDPREIGQEPTPAAYVDALVDVFERCRRVLRDDGTLWLNLGDCYNTPAGSATNPGMNQKGKRGPVYRAGDGYRKDKALPAKNLIGIPWCVAFALQDAGWILRSDIIWAKTNCMPESVTDRPTRSHEYVFLFSKNERYFYDAAAIAEPSVSTHGSGNGFKRPARRSYQNGDGTARGNDAPWEPTETRNARSVWSLATSPLPDEHYAPMPLALAERCIKAGSAAQACEMCGAPWARVVERTDEQLSSAPTSNRNTRLARDGSNGIALDHVARGNSRPPRDAYNRSVTTGWAPSCACPGATGSSASVVLDPFAGSGTTGRAALALQRRAVLIDLGYTDLQERRTDGVQMQMVELL